MCVCVGGWVGVEQAVAQREQTWTRKTRKTNKTSNSSKPAYVVQLADTRICNESIDLGRWVAVYWGRMNVYFITYY